MAIEVRPKAQVFSTRVPLLSEGRTNNYVVRTDLMSVNVKVYAEGGENALHTHTNEDHVFLVLQGEATFSDEEGTKTVVHKLEGISLPRGAYYWFKSTGDENLVLCRFGASTGERGDGRIDIEGMPLPGESEANKHIEGVSIPGKFFGD